MSRATAAEDAATTVLRERCYRRNVALKAAACTGGWRGVLFHLGAESHAIVVTRATRLLLVESLSRVVAQRWPLKTGKPAERRAA